jgi:hypothetical protein
MARGKGAKVGDVIDVEVVDDSEAHEPSGRPVKFGIGTVARPCLIGIAVLTVVGAVLPR